MLHAQVGWELNRNSKNYGLELSFGPYLPTLVYCNPKLKDPHSTDHLKLEDESQKNKRSLHNLVTREATQTKLNDKGRINTFY